MDQFQDKSINCRDCNQPFLLPAGEQQFFAEKGLHMPSRCKDCRQKKKMAAMANGGASEPGGGYAVASPPRPVVIEQAPPQRGGGRHNKSGRRNRDEYND
jgi:hypothetical protein